MIQDSDEENEGRNVLKNKFKAIGNRKPNTEDRCDKHKQQQNQERSWIVDEARRKDQQQNLERARIVDEARRKNTYDAKSLGLKKLGMMDLTFN